MKRLMIVWCVVAVCCVAAAPALGSIGGFNPVPYPPVGADSPILHVLRFRRWC